MAAWGGWRVTGVGRRVREWETRGCTREGCVGCVGGGKLGQICFPPPAGGGTDEGVVIQVRVGSGGSSRRSRATFPPSAGGGTSEVVVQVLDGSGSNVGPSRAHFPPPNGGGTQAIVVVGLKGVGSSFRMNPARFPSPAWGGTVGDPAPLRAAARGWLCCRCDLSSAGHLDLRVAGGVLRCESRTFGQAPPAPVELNP